MGDWGLGIGDWGLGPIPNPLQKYFNELFYYKKNKLIVVFKLI
jgi:hypothetical protein